MLAGHFTGPRRIELVDVPEPKLLPPGELSPGELHPGQGQILFQPELACLCGSDLPYFDGEVPCELGHSLHEMVGTVVATNGARFQAGDRVLAVPLDQRGLFERFVLDEQRAIPLDPRAAEEHALLAQPLGTVLFALKKIPDVLDRDIAVVGQGPIGQLFCLALRNLGARQIIAIDRLESRLERSRRHGATAVVCAGTCDPVQAVNELTAGHMAEIVIEAVGHGDQALNLCLDLACHGGRILYFGVPPQQIDGVRWLDLFVKNLTVHTSVNPDFGRDFPLAMRWIGEGRIDVSGLVTHRYPLAEIQQAFETFRDRREGALKVLLEFPSHAHQRQS